MDGWWAVALGCYLGASDDEWRQTLMGLDLHRAAAYAAGDPTRLGQVYASPEASSDDAEIIEAYADRGGVIEGVLLQVEAVSVVERTERRVHLDVTDRLGPARVRWSGDELTVLPADRPTRHLVVLVMTGDGWRISESRPAGPT